VRRLAQGPGLSDSPAARGDDLPLLRRLGLHREQATDQAANRYFQLGIACVNHMCMGSVFALSVFNSSLTRLQGVVASAGADWLLADVGMVFTLVMSGFAWGGVFSRYHDKLGVKACGVLSAGCLLTGFSVSALASCVHSLPLLYAGGLVWGMGIGWGYVPAVANALRWFPDRKGFAGGATVAGFGAGSIAAAPLFRQLMARNQRPPEFAGPTDAPVVGDGGRLFLDGAEVVACRGLDAIRWGLDEGFYTVGTGSCGVAETFATCGVAYSAIVLLYSALARAPPADAQAESKASSAVQETDPRKAQFSREFLLMTAGFGLASTGSYALISTGHTMLMEIYGARLPDLITPEAGAAFVSALGLGNLAGRLAWPAVSDALAARLGSGFAGRRTTFTMMWTLSPLAYVGVLMSPHCPGTTLPVAVFTASAMAAVMALGGAAATRPAFVADAWGPQAASPLLAKSMGALWLAAYAGPRLMAHCRESAVSAAAHDLVRHVDPAAFERAFRAPVGELQMLLEQRTVTLPALLDLCGPGAVDPSPFIYSQGLSVCVLCQAAALATNLALRQPGASAKA